MTAELFTTWPAMAVHPVRLLKEWLTADEMAGGQLTFDDHTGVMFSSIDLPPTGVAIVPHVLRTFLSGNGDVGTVDACTATGTEPEGIVTIELEAEPVVVVNGQIIAKQMPATAKVILNNGDVWSSVGVSQPTGYGCFPETKIISGVAQPVTAKFRLEKK